MTREDWLTTNDVAAMLRYCKPTSEQLYALAATDDDSPSGDAQHFIENARRIWMVWLRELSVKEEPYLNEQLAKSIRELIPYRPQ